MIKIKINLNQFQACPKPSGAERAKAKDYIFHGNENYYRAFFFRYTSTVL